MQTLRRAGLVLALCLFTAVISRSAVAGWFAQALLLEGAPTTALPAMGSKNGIVYDSTLNRLRTWNSGTQSWSTMSDATAGQSMTGGIKTATVGSPTLDGGAFTASLTGSLTGGTAYYYKVSSLTDIGETVPGTEQLFTPTLDGGVNVTWPLVAGAKSYNVYGRTTGAEQLIGNVLGSATSNGGFLSLLDDGSVSPSGAIPTVDKSFEILDNGLGVLAVHGSSTAPQAFESGTHSLAGTADGGNMAFTTAFASTPNCACTDQTGSFFVSCTVDAGTGLVIIGHAPDVISYVCAGPK
jgi:hypothetical protein